MVRAFAAGVSGSAVLASLSRFDLASAQDDKASSIGNPDIAHITTTDKGTIKLYSSWPLSGAMTQTGNDAVAAIKLALEDYGNAAGGFALEYTALDDGIAANNGQWDAGVNRGKTTQTLFFKAMGMQMGGGDMNTQLSPEGAAEFLWNLLISRLQQ